MRDIDRIVVHCAATPPDLWISAEDIDHWHKRRGWSCIGYHWVISRDGDLQKGRSPKRPGAHVRGFNKASLGICLVGGVDENFNPENNFTPEQFETLRTTLITLIHLYPDAVILGHRDHPGVKKACPSFDVYSWGKDSGIFDTPSWAV